MKLRHLFYDKGWLESYNTEIPSICVGNVAVGGTGKTPTTELLIRTLSDNGIPAADAEYLGFEPGSLFSSVRHEVAVLSRGYKRKTKGFLLVTSDGSADQYGDEPLQIKKKFPEVTVAVDADRVEGCNMLAHSADIARPDVIILDDAFQYRRIKATGNIVLTTYSRPYFKDSLLPFGRLRDLRSRVSGADMVIVTKCPTYMDEQEKREWAAKMKLSAYDPSTCEGVTPGGKVQKLLFATVSYDSFEPVFPDADKRYIHAKTAILFSGIVDDGPLTHKISETFRIMDHIKYPDHHRFAQRDVRDITASATLYATAIVITTEKDAQRIRDGRLEVGEDLRHRMFYVPIRFQMLTKAEQDCLETFLSKITRN